MTPSPKSSCGRCLVGEVTSPIVNIMKELYKDNKAYVRVGNKLSEVIYPTKGLRQGCSLSPLLFNIYLEVALQQWRRSCGRMGITIGEDCLFNIQFADDQAVIAQDSYDLEFMLIRLYEAYKTCGLNVNVNKTDYLVVNSEARL